MVPPLPKWLSSTLASDAMDGQGHLPCWIRPLNPGLRWAGPVHVVMAATNDNLAVREALHHPPAGPTVLVVCGHQHSTTATLGDLMALELQNLGFSGLVTDGLVRDSRDIQQLDFPVWCRGATPVASAKREVGQQGGMVELEGVVVRQGDFVIADADGVVFWPSDQLNTLLQKAWRRKERDEQRLQKLLQARPAQ